MKRTLLCAAVFFGFAAASIPSSAHAKFKVGVILALSGDFSAFGNACRNGIELARQDIGKDFDNRMDLLFEDDALMPRKAADSFQKLSATQGINAVITFASGSSNAVAPLAEAARIPLISIAASDPRVVQGRPYAFSLWVSPTTEAALAFREAKRRDYKRIARIGTTHEGVLAIKHAFDAQNQGAFQIILDEEYAPDVKDFRGYVAKLRNQSKVDALFTLLLPGHNGILAKELRQQGVHIPIFGVETLEDPNDIKVAEGALLNAWYIQAADPSEEFTKKFLGKFPDSSLYAAPHCYDAVRMLFTALKTETPVRKFLNDLKDFQGALGTFSSTNDGHFSLPASVKVITEEGFKTLPTPPDVAPSSPAAQRDKESEKGKKK